VHENPEHLLLGLRTERLKMSIQRVRHEMRSPTFDLNLMSDANAQVIRWTSELREVQQTMARTQPSVREKEISEEEPATTEATNEPERLPLPTEPPEDEEEPEYRPDEEEDRPDDEY
jgi:hypothetical protein